ncbi:MAG: FtsX-like permease family protein [Pseudomonadota bacterium]
MFRLSLTMTLRDWRAGELRFLLAALALAVAALSTIGFFTDRVSASFVRDANQSLGADLLVTADAPLDPAWRSEALRRGLAVAETVELASMAFSAEGRGQLISLKAVTPGYPLRGALRLRQGQGDAATRSTPAKGSVWIDRTLASVLSLHVGDVLRLGDARLVVAQVLSAEPDRGVSLVGYAPRAMIDAGDLPATGLLQLGSFAKYRLLVAGDPLAVEAAAKSLPTMLERQRRLGVTLDTAADNRSGLRSAFEQAGRFLALVGMLSTMLAAVAVAMAARRFMLRHIDAVAMLRCLGLAQRKVLALYALQFLWIGLAASALGVLAGFAAHFALIAWLGDLMGAALAPPSGWPALGGTATGLLLLAGFALPPILALRNVPHNHVLRGERGAPQAPVLLAAALGALALLGLLLWQAGDLALGLLTAGAFAGAALVFAILARLAVAALAFAGRLLPSPAWRFAIAEMRRRPGATVTMALGLSLGLMAMLLLTMVRADLLAAWQGVLPADMPNKVIINVQADQHDLVARRLAPFGQAPLFPVLRARLVRINGKAPAFDDERARATVTRELDLSTMPQLAGGNAILKGAWFADLQGKPEVSVAEGAAELLGLKLGDRLMLDLAGTQFDATVTSIRKVDWRSRRMNFAFILNPRAAAGQPASWTAAVHVPAADEDGFNRLSRDFPNLTVIDVEAFVANIQRVMERLARTAQFMFLFTLGAGVLVLAATLASSADERRRQLAILRALGASRSQLERAQWIEHALVGALAGVLAAAGATAASWALARMVFDLPWHFSPALWSAGLAVGALCALLGAWRAVAAVLNHPPLLTLRAT